jgi:hypothetical protein
MGSNSAPREHQLVEELRELRSKQHEVEDEIAELQARGLAAEIKRNGAGAAAMVAAAVGVFAIGLLTTLAAASEDVKDWLNWYNPAGPLSGKTTLGTIIWLVVWIGAHYVLRRKEVNLNKMAMVSAVILAIGLLLMFPPIFQLFE